jgi:hypothetical protein
LVLYTGLLNEELTDLYCSPNVVRVIKLRTMKWRGMEHVGGEERFIQDFGGGNLRLRDHLEEPGIDGSIVFRWIYGSSGSEMEGMDWIDLAQNRDRWRVLVKAVMNLRVP